MVLTRLVLRMLTKLTKESGTSVGSLEESCKYVIYSVYLYQFVLDTSLWFGMHWSDLYQGSIQMVRLNSEEVEEVPNQPFHGCPSYSLKLTKHSADMNLNVLLEISFNLHWDLFVICGLSMDFKHFNCALRSLICDHLYWQHYWNLIMQRWIARCKGLWVILLKCQYLIQYIKWTYPSTNRTKAVSRFIRLLQI